MRIQCSCGAKYSFEVTPQMLQQPIRFVCQQCGLDSSDGVNQLIREELGAVAATAAPAPAPQPAIPVAKAVPVARAVAVARAVPMAAAVPMAPAVPVAAPVAMPAVARAVSAAPAAPRIRIQAHANAAEDPTAEAAPVAERCAKHSDLATERCRVCSKPICPRCMELFGYVCSPLCRGKADAQGIRVPVFAGQKSVAEARLWRKVGLMVGSAVILIAAVLGVWFWYAWFGSTPKQFFSVRFETVAFSGQSILCGQDQIVFLHGGTLARHDMKDKKQVWSRYLIDKKQIEEEVAAAIKQTKLLIDKANHEGWENTPKMPDPEKLARSLERGMAASLQLRVQGQNIWVGSPGKLVRYDWVTGNPSKEIALNEHYGQIIPRGDELLLFTGDSDKPAITHVNLTTCDTRTEEIAGNAPKETAEKKPAPAAGKKTASAPVRKPSSKETAGLPTVPGRDSGKPLDPSKVADQAAHLPLPAKIALPALLANTMNQDRLLAEMNNRPRPVDADSDDFESAESFSLVPTRDGFVQFAVRLLERKVIHHSAMKAPPKKSALEGNVTAAQSMEVANEILNEMQRSRGGDTVSEDVSRYQVTIRRPDGKDSWSGEVIGPPRLLPLKTVNVLAANKCVMVFDKANKKLWQGTLSYNVRAVGGTEEGDALYGQGPCVERTNTLYVIDEGVLTAFDLATGNARWRVPSVGIAGIFFDDKEMLYVNTTTASPETIKYSRQIDVSQKVSSVILKIDPRTGATLWTAEPGGLINHVSGKYIYSVQYFMPDDEEDEPEMVTGFEARPYLKIKRINPSNGKEMWEHFQQRGPLDVQIEKNTIHLVFKKEVQVLKFLAL
jgi:hypothetical protein